MDTVKFNAVIQTPKQRKLYKERVGKIDATCADTVNHWGFTVVTLNVYTKVDSCPPIFPLTWLITSSSTAHVYIRTFY
jgi:hypothetical protein